MILYTIKKSLESRMLGKLHVRFGGGGGVQLPALHHEGATKGRMGRIFRLREDIVVSGTALGL